MADLDFKAIARNLDRFLTETKAKNLVLGESHTDAATNLRLLSDPNIQSVLQKHGFYDIALEARHEFQKDEDKVGQGKMTPEALGEKAVQTYRAAGDAQAESARALYEARGHLAEVSERRGMMIHFDEKQGDLPAYLKLFDKQDAMLQAEQAAAKKNQSIVGNIAGGIEYKVSSLFNYQAGMDDATRRFAKVDYEGVKNDPAAKALDESFYKERLANDKSLAAGIKSETQGRNTVVLYGEAHADHLRSDLGQGTVSVTLCATHDEYINFAQRDQTLGLPKPNAYLDLSGAKFVDGNGLPAQTQIQNNQSATPRAKALGA